MNNYNGVINIYKEEDFTSHDVVAKLRGILRQKKIGHTGTLDPKATGVLPVLLGNATVLSDMLTDKSKEYEAVILFGISTDTEDMTGGIISKADVSQLSEEAVINCINSFVGEYMQMPPMYSALKVNGKKLVDLAREGVVIERKKRLVNIFDIEILSVSLPRVKFRVKVSKGTYIRSLCRDIGDELGVPSCMESLIRTRTDRFELKDAIKLSKVCELVEKGEISEKILSVEEYFSDLDNIKTKKECDKFLLNGNKLTKENIEGDKDIGTELVRAYSSSDRFLGIYRRFGNEFKPFKMFMGE